MAIIKTKLDKEVIIEDLTQDRPSFETMEFLSAIWNTGFCSDFGIHGDMKKSTFHRIDTVNFKIEDISIETHRTNYLKESYQKLNGVKEMKDVLKALQIPIQKICEETHKKKPLLKPELQSIINSYITI